MREVKFRAKPIENDSIDKQVQVTGKDWIYGGGAIQVPSGKWAFIHLNDEERLTVTVIDPETLCEWTGLVDKNGADVYEHDLVNNPDATTWEMVFEGGGFWPDGWDDDWHSRNIVKWEVVGNVFDNPELAR